MGKPLVSVYVSYDVLGSKGWGSGGWGRIQGWGGGADPGLGAHPGVGGGGGLIQGWRMTYFSFSFDFKQTSPGFCKFIFNCFNIKCFFKQFNFALYGPMALVCILTIKIHTR